MKLCQNGSQTRTGTTSICTGVGRLRGEVGDAQSGEIINWPRPTLVLASISDGRSRAGDVVLELVRDSTGEFDPLA